jgi:hypothetical protein
MARYGQGSSPRASCNLRSTKVPSLKMTGCSTSLYAADKFGHAILHVRCGILAAHLYLHHTSQIIVGQDQQSPGLAEIPTKRAVKSVHGGRLLRTADDKSSESQSRLQVAIQLAKIVAC